MKFSFDVGEKEKHNIYFHWNQLWGSLRISVDGETIERRFFQIASPNEPAQKNDISTDEIWIIHGKRIKLVDRWEFTVGDNERHTILIIKKRKKWNAGVRTQNYRVFVDGVVILNRTGY